MFTKCSTGLAVVLCMFVYIQGAEIDTNSFASVLAFPESGEQDPGRQNAMNKTPLHLPTRCKVGELFYPGDHFDDWVCDCRPRYIYYPERDECYEAYRRGPCGINQYLVLPKNSVLPVCVPNPCFHDSYVPLGNGCYKLETPGPCPPSHIDNVVGVNETTLELICTRGFLNTRFSETTTVPIPVDASTTPEPVLIDGEFYRKKDCLPGGKRWKHERCPQQVQFNQAIADIYGPQN